MDAQRHPRDGPRRRRLPPLPARGRRPGDGGARSPSTARRPTRPPATPPRRCCGTPGAGAALDACVDALKAAGVEMRGDAATRKRAPVGQAGDRRRLRLRVRRQHHRRQAGGAASTRRWPTSPRNGSKHTEAIVTRDRAAAERFLRRGRRRRRLPQRQHPLRRRLPLRPGRRGRHQHRQAARPRPRRRRRPADLPLAAARRRPGHGRLRPRRQAVQVHRDV